MPPRLPEEHQRGSTAAVAVHGRTPAWRMTVRTSRTTVRWLSTLNTW